LLKIIKMGTGQFLINFIGYSFYKKNPLSDSGDLAV